MRKLSSINLDLMEEELPVLEQELLESVKGGYSQNNWGCFFNAMEFVGKINGVSMSDQDYYKEFKSMFGYDPAQTNGVASISDMVQFYSTYMGGCQDVTSRNGTEMMFIPSTSSDGSIVYHAVIPLGVENGELHYYDPTYQKFGNINNSKIVIINSGGSGYIDNFDSYFDDDSWRSGIYDYISGNYDYMSGNYDPNGSYYA